MLKCFVIWALICCSVGSVFCQNTSQPLGISDGGEERYLFITRQNGLYGFTDLNGRWLDQAPMGDTIFHIRDKHFAVREKNGLYTIYNEQLQSVYQQASEIREFGAHAFLKDSKGWMVFPLNETPTNEHYDSIRIQGAYAWLYRNGKQGLLKNDASLKDLIPPVYDKVGLYYDGILLINNGKLGWQGACSIPVNYDHIYQERPDIMAAKNKAGTVYYSYNGGQRLMAEPSDIVVFYDRYYKRIRGNTQSIFRVSNNRLIAEITGEQLHPYSFDRSYGESGYFVIGRDSVCALYSEGKVLTGFEYRNILPEASIKPPYFRVLKDQGVGVIFENGEVQLAANYTDVISQWDNYYVVRKGSKLGLAQKGDSLLLPFAYENITFCDDTYLYLTQDGKHFGLYNYLSKKEISPYKYRNFSIDTTFIIATQEVTSDIYYKDQAVFTDLYDVMSNGTTVKGYKGGKVYIGAVRNGTWESYEYEIPSYKIKKEKGTLIPLTSTRLTNVSEIYDYASGKWGRFSYTTGTWRDVPLAHGGDNSGNDRLLGFPVDSTISWQGIAFHAIKKVSPIQIAWNRRSKFNWVDLKPCGYPSDYEKNTSLPVSPICYTEPGNGKGLNNYGSTIINTSYGSDISKSVISEGGHVKIGNYGQIGLSQFLSQISACGNVHPLDLKDYETIIDPNLFVSISGGTEHVLQTAFRTKHISARQAFEWVDKTSMSPLICRVAGKYGLLSDTGAFLLKPEHEYISPAGSYGNMMFKVGVRSGSYRVFYPETHTYSREIPQLLSFKGALLLVKADSLRMAVLDHRLDTLLLSAGTISLLEDSGYVLKKDGISTVYKNRKVLFSHTCDLTEKINDGHYLISNSTGNYILTPAGDTVYQSKRAIKYLSLGNNYLLDSGQERTVFDLSDKVVTKFQREPYLVTEHQHLIIKEKESLVLLKKNGTKQQRINGRYARATKLYVVSRTAKTKQVSDYSGKILVSKAAKVKVINDRYFSYQQGKKFMLYDVISGDKKRIERLGVNVTKEGLEYDDSDEEDDSTQVVETIEDLYTIASYRGKYGLKKEDKLILPYSYFHIQKAEEVFLVQNRVNYKLYNSSRNAFVSNDIYETIYPYKDHFQVCREGKIYYIKR